MYVVRKYHGHASWIDPKHLAEYTEAEFETRHEALAHCERLKVKGIVQIYQREYPEIKSIQDVWDKDDLGGYQTQRYSRKLNKVIVTNDLTAISNDLKIIGLTLADFKQQLTLF
jgi:hypothetical protein